MPNRIKYCIIGIPDHQGVLALRGRVGASHGPAHFRKAFTRLNGRFNPLRYTVDEGDIPGLGFSVERNHELASKFIAEKIQGRQKSIIVGGSHDHGFSHLNGIFSFLKRTSRSRSRSPRIACINIDAHLDVRKPAPTISSGSPFYLALESHILDPKLFIEFGIQSHCNAEELWRYVEGKMVKVIPFKKLRNGAAVRVFKNCVRSLSRQADAIVVSLDLDALSFAYAPGVSAPQAEGLTAMEVIEMLEFAGSMKKVISLGIFELNPEHDLEGQTSRLAATAAFHFLEGSEL
jgi:formimidoylglutamase